MALFGGPKAVRSKPRDLFRWPIITNEDRRAVLEVLNRGAMSQLGVTKAFEAEFAQWQGTRYALAHSTGTAALEGAMFGCGIGRGDEVICQSVTYWASAMPCYNVGATVVFGEIDPATLCLAPDDIERRISKRTKAILVVHYIGLSDGHGPDHEDRPEAQALRHRGRVACPGRIIQGEETRHDRRRGGDVAHEREVLRRSARAGSW